MRREYIRTTPSWRKGRARYDCVFVNARPELGGMRGLEVARVFLFFLFVHGNTGYPCALVQWFLVIGNEPDDETDVRQNGQPHLTIIHLDSIYRAAHLIPAYCTSGFIERSLTMHDTLDKFKVFYENKFVDHHAFELAS
jgi:hypothetical protein